MPVAWIVVEELAPIVTEGMWTMGDAEHVVCQCAFTHIPGTFPLLRVSHSRSSQRCILGIPRCENRSRGRGHPGWLVIRSGAAGRGSRTVTASARDSRAAFSFFFEARHTADQPQRTILIWCGASKFRSRQGAWRRLGVRLPRGSGARVSWRGFAQRLVQTRSRTALDIDIDTTSESKMPAQVTGAI